LGSTAADDDEEPDEADHNDAKTRSNQPQPYKMPLKFGTVIKLYIHMAGPAAWRREMFVMSLSATYIQLALPFG